MNKRVAVRVALMLVALVLLAAALPFSASAQSYIYGHVWELDSFYGPEAGPWGEADMDPMGAGVMVDPAAGQIRVVLKRNGQVVRVSNVTSENGDWGFGISGNPGVYTVEVWFVPAGGTPQMGGDTAMAGIALSGFGNRKLHPLNPWTGSGSGGMGKIRVGISQSATGSWTYGEVLSPNPVYTIGPLNADSPDLIGPIDFIYKLEDGTAEPYEVPPGGPNPLPVIPPGIRPGGRAGVTVRVIDLATGLPAATSVGICLYELGLDAEGRPLDKNIAANWTPVTRWLGGPSACANTRPSGLPEDTQGGWGYAGIFWSWKPTWYRLFITAPGGYTVLGDRKKGTIWYEFAYAQGVTSVYKLRQANWFLPGDPYPGQIVMYVTSSP